MEEKSRFEEKYKIVNFIAHGRFAAVSLCVDKSENLEYAAKVIKKKKTERARRGATAQSIAMEIEVLQNFNHSNIIKIYDSFIYATEAILILELVPGGELFEYIYKQGTLSEEEASKFLHQILLGVSHIHSHNIIHLDLKPENILVENAETQKIKIIDFGLARKVEEAEVLCIQGTAAFVAPEIVNYEALTFATDMWSIGIITFTMLNGFNPFVGENDNETFSNILKCELDLTEERCCAISDLAQDFIRNLIVRNSKERLLSEACLDHRWIKSEEVIKEKQRRSFIARDKVDKLREFVVSPRRPTSVIDRKPSEIHVAPNRLSLPSNVFKQINSQFCINNNENSDEVNEEDEFNEDPFNFDSSESRDSSVVAVNSNR